MLSKSVFGNLSSNVPKHARNDFMPELEKLFFYFYFVTLLRAKNVNPLDVFEINFFFNQVHLVKLTNNIIEDSQILYPEI